MGADVVLHKSQSEEAQRGRSPSGEDGVTSAAGPRPEGERPLRVKGSVPSARQRLSEPAARRISGAETWESSLR